MNYPQGPSESAHPPVSGGQPGFGSLLSPASMMSTKLLYLLDALWKLSPRYLMPFSSSSILAA
jgi:hypothetical protein